MIMQATRAVTRSNAPLRVLPAVALGIAFSMGLVLSPASARSGVAPFAGMAGSWFGEGAIDLSNGSREPIRCRARYAVGAGGSEMQQDLVCASDSYRFNVDSNVVEDGGEISGTWNETTRNVGGELSGVARGGQIDAQVSGGAFVARLTVQTNGNSQFVTITPQGTDVRAVSVRLRKR
jgi:hypothetical protein